MKKFLKIYWLLFCIVYLYDNGKMIEFKPINNERFFDFQSCDKRAKKFSKTYNRKFFCVREIF